MFLQRNPMNLTQIPKTTFNLVAEKAKRNNLSIKYEHKKYELKTHKIGIIYNNAIKKEYKRDQNRYGGHLMPA